MKVSFKAYDFSVALQFLQNGYKQKVQSTSRPTMLVVAGPNASGKSTYIANLYAQNLLHYPYINADIIQKFELADIQNEEERNVKGMRLAMQRVEEAIQNKTSFVYETVLSHPSKLDLVQKAKENGFTIKTIFVFTNHPSINIQRLKTRVASGGHDVPEEKVVQRYYRSLENGKLLKDLSDEYTEFNNSKELPLVCVKEKQL